MNKSEQIFESSTLLVLALYLPCFGLFTKVTSYLTLTIIATLSEIYNFVSSVIILRMSGNPRNEG